MLRTHITMDSVELEILNLETIKTKLISSSLLVFTITPKSTLPWKYKIKHEISDENNILLPIKDFGKRLIKGDLIGFIAPVKNKS